MSPLESLCEILGCPEYAAPLRTVAARFGHAPRAFSYALEHISDWYDLGLPGVKLLIRALLREFLLVFEKTDLPVIYSSVPSPGELGLALNATGKVRVHTAEFCAMVVMRGIFGLGINVAQKDSSGSRCAMLENRAAFIEDGTLPPPSLLWSFGLLCDECCKTDEGLKGAASVSVSCPRGAGAEGIDLYEKALDISINEVCNFCGIESPAYAEPVRAWRSVQLLSGFITCANNAAADPPLGAGTVSLIHSALLCTFSDVSELIAALNEIYTAMRKSPRSSAGGKAQRPKLYCYYIPPCIPELGAIFEKRGIALVGDGAFISLPTGTAPRQGLAGAAASSWQHSVLSRSSRETAAAIAAAIKQYDCFGYLTGMFSFDRWLGSFDKLSLPEIERLSGRPAFRFHTDFWGRDFDGLRAEDFAETIASVLQE